MSVRGVPLERPLTRVGSPTTTSCCGSLTGSILSKSAFTTVKIAVFAPMPKARVTMATAVNPGLLRNWRSAKRRSWSSPFIVNSSLVTQSDHWIDPHCTPRRNKTGQQCNAAQERGDCGERNGVSGSNSKKHACQQMREAESGDNPNQGSDEG